jgi:hypothetical protein
MSYLVKYTGAGVAGLLSPDAQSIYWKNLETRWVEEECIAFYQEHSGLFTILAGPTDIDELLFSRAMFYGSYSAANIDFNTGAAEAGCKVTIGGVDYQEAAVAVPATGVWAKGASAADSRTSLIAAINGDTRAAVPFTAVADVSGDGVWIFWDTAGETNVNITTTSAARITVPVASTGGLNQGTKKVWNTWHTATAQELLSGAVEIPLPFSVETLIVQARSAVGAPIYFTDLVTVEPNPVRLRIKTNGATNLANTDMVHVILMG